MAKLATQPKPATSALVKTPTQPEVALRYHKDGESYWVKGYEVFDPEVAHSTNGGRQPLKIKAGRTRPGCVWLIMRGQRGKPVQYDQSRVVLVQPGKHYFTFQEVFGSAAGTSVVVVNATIDREDDDDLAMGLTVNLTEEAVDF